MNIIFTNPKAVKQLFKRGTDTKSTAEDNKPKNNEHEVPHNTCNTGSFTHRLNEIILVMATILLIFTVVIGARTIIGDWDILLALIIFIHDATELPVQILQLYLKGCLWSLIHATMLSQKYWLISFSWRLFGLMIIWPDFATGDIPLVRKKFHTK